MIDAYFQACSYLTLEAVCDKVSHRLKMVPFLRSYIIHNKN